MITLRSLLVGFSVVAFLVLPLVGQVEDEPTWTGSQGYKGLVITEGYGPPGAKNWATTINESGGTKQAEGIGLYRYLTFTDGSTILYEFKARPVPDKEGSFEVTIGPYMPTAQQAAYWKIDLNSVETRFLRKYPASFVVQENEVIAIDIAENPKTGQKLVHYYVVSMGKPFLRANLERKANQAREFRAEDVDLSVFDYDLRRNGSSLYRSGGGCSGKYVSINIPDVGLFWFTLAPPPVGAGFQPNALGKDRQLSFRYGEDTFDWLAKSDVIPGDGLFTVWMRADPPRGPSFTVRASNGAPPVK